MSNTSRKSLSGLFACVAAMLAIGVGADPSATSESVEATSSTTAPTPALRPRASGGTESVDGTGAAAADVNESVDGTGVAAAGDSESVDGTGIAAAGDNESVDGTGIAAADGTESVDGTGRQMAPAVPELETVEAAARSSADAIAAPATGPVDTESVDGTGRTDSTDPDDD